MALATTPDFESVAFLSREDPWAAREAFCQADKLGDLADFFVQTARGRVFVAFAVSRRGQFQFIPFEEQLKTGFCV
jgi:hypothetical protein